VSKKKKTIPPAKLVSEVHDEAGNKNVSPDYLFDNSSETPSSNDMYTDSYNNCSSPSSVASDHKNMTLLGDKLVLLTQIIKEVLPSIRANSSGGYNIKTVSDVVFKQAHDISQLDIQSALDAMEARNVIMVVDEEDDKIIYLV
jgi:hypothetical protein